MLILAAIASIATIGWIAYSSGKEALQASALNQLTSVRASKKTEIEAFFKTIQNQVANLVNGRMMVAAMRELSGGFDKFQTVRMEDSWDSMLRQFYLTEFLPKLAKGTGTSPTMEAFYPVTPEARYAQYLYIANNPNPPIERFEYKDAKDGSSYSAAHARYHPIISKYIQDFHYDNLILVSQAGYVVYTFNKSPLFGTNLLFGPYKNGNTADLFRSLRKSSSIGEVKVEDFAHSTSAAGRPVGLMGAAIFDGTDQIGVLLMQFPVDEINRVMTDNFGWVQDGLGRTGEVYLVGGDGLMRSRSRLLHEDSALFFQQLEKAHYSAEDVARVRRFGTATLAQPARTKAVALADAGKTGTAIFHNYRGVEVLSAYAPLYVFGLHWVIVAEVETSEAFAPLTDLTGKILLSSLTMILIVSALATFLGRRFVKPILQLVDGVHRLEAGEKGVSVAVSTRDEFVDLGDAFNHMSDALVSTSAALRSRTEERDALLNNLLPVAAAGKVRDGLPVVVDEYPSITVVYALVIPLEQSTWSSSAAEALGILTRLTVSLDEAAAQNGVEKLGGNGSTYVACCDISGNALDHAARAVTFAQDLIRQTNRLRNEHFVKLRVQVGVESGPAVGTVVGRKRFHYFLSGDPMTVAGILAGYSEADAILVGEHAHAALPPTFIFRPSGKTVPLEGRKSITAWQLEPEAVPAQPQEAVRE